MSIQPRGGYVAKAMCYSRKGGATPEMETLTNLLLVVVIIIVLVKL